MKYYKHFTFLLSLTYMLSALATPFTLMAAEDGLTGKENSEVNDAGEGIDPVDALLDAIQPAENFVPEEDPLGINAPAAILIDAQSGITVYEKGKNEIKYPASITKVMTALLALELSEGDLTQRISFSKEAVLLPPGSSNIGMYEGDTLTLEDALYALMLASANEVGNAIAEHFGGTIDAFCIAMTERAKRLGAQNTNFINPHGLHDDNHYTTAYDMALIMKEAVKHPKFVEIIGTKSSFIAPTEMQELERPLNNTNKMLFEGGTYYYDYIVGGKTGFVDEAGNTLVSYAQKDNMGLIAVVLHENGSNFSYNDTKALFEYGFEQYAMIDVFDRNGFTDSISVLETVDGKTTELGMVSVVPENSVTMFIPSNIDTEKIEWDVDLAYRVEAPVQKNEIMGTLTLMYEGLPINTVNLISSESFDLNTAPAMARSSEKTATGGTSFLVTVLKAIGFGFIVLSIFLSGIAITARVMRYRRRQRKLAAKRKAKAKARARAKAYEYEQYERAYVQYRYRNN